MVSGKATPICLLRVLDEYSDENHILTMGEIRSKLNTGYGISPDRRTVYGAISLLASIGIETSTYEENGSGYYLKTRLFEPSEVRLLMDAVYSFPFLPAKHSEDLITKLQKLMCVHERRSIKHMTVARSDVKTSNRQVFWTIDQLDKAISQKLKVSFTYLKYNTHKELVSRRDDKYTVNPCGIMLTNDYYYLVCVKDNKKNVSMYRIDKMKDLQITNDPMVLCEQGIDPKESTMRAVYAYSGEPELITLRCRRNLLDHVIDKHGTDIQIMELDSESLEISFTAAPEGVKFWALQYLPNLEIISPQWLRDEIIDCIKSNPYLETEREGVIDA